VGSRSAHDGGGPTERRLLVTVELVAVPDATLGAGDPTRRWGVRCSDDRVRWPGITRLEAATLMRGLSAAAAAPDDVLAQLELGVVLSDGAGPYLADADGLLVLVVDGHPSLAGVHIAMGQTGPHRVRIGVVRPLAGGGCWSWICRVEVPASALIGVLDGLVAADTDGALQAWVARAKSVGIP
jgi:hypothetical protein